MGLPELGYQTGSEEMSRSNVCKLSTKFVLLGPGLCGSKSPSASSSMFDEPRISRPHSHHLRAELRHSMFARTCSRSPIGLESTLWRLERGGCDACFCGASGSGRS